MYLSSVHGSRNTTFRKQKGAEWEQQSHHGGAQGGTGVGHLRVQRVGMKQIKMFKNPKLRSPRQQAATAQVLWGLEECPVGKPRACDLVPACALWLGPLSLAFLGKWPSSPLIPEWWIRGLGEPVLKSSRCVLPVGWFSFLKLLEPTPNTGWGRPSVLLRSQKRLLL